MLLYGQRPVVYLRSAALQLLRGPSKNHWLCRWWRTWGTQIWCPSPCHTPWPAAGPASRGTSACTGSVTWTKPPWVGQSSALGYFLTYWHTMVLVAASGRQGCSNPAQRLNRDAALSQSPQWKGDWGLRPIKEGWGASAVCPANGRIRSIPKNTLSLFLDKMLVLSQNTISEDETAII